MVVIVPSPRSRGQLHDKIVSNIQEIRARGARTIVIAEEGDDAVTPYASDLIRIPVVPDAAAAARGHGAAAGARLRARHAQGPRRRPAAQPREVRDGGVARPAPSREAGELGGGVHGTAHVGAARRRRGDRRGCGRGGAGLDGGRPRAAGLAGLPRSVGTSSDRQLVAVLRGGPAARRRARPRRGGPRLPGVGGDRGPARPGRHGRLHGDASRWTRSSTSCPPPTSVPGSSSPSLPECSPWWPPSASAPTTDVGDRRSKAQQRGIGAGSAPA